MKDLFLSYKEQNMISEALIVGQNMFNRFPGNVEYFNLYFDLLVELAHRGDVEQRSRFLQNAMTAVAAFSESVELTPDIVDDVRVKEEILERVYESIEKERAEQVRAATKEKVKFNEDALALIERLLKQLKSTTAKNEFDKLLQNIGDVDSSLEKEYLTDRQVKKYKELTNLSSGLVSEKMTYFENQSNREYNLRAIEAYEKAYNMFKNGQVIATHKEVIKNLFAFDASRLYNETLVYYNHVYNYILGKLDDDEKFIMTKYAILSERRGGK